MKKFIVLNIISAVCIAITFLLLLTTPISYVEKETEMPVHAINEVSYKDYIGNVKELSEPLQTTADAIAKMNNGSAGFFWTIAPMSCWIGFLFAIIALLEGIAGLIISVVGIFVGLAGLKSKKLQSEANADKSGLGFVTKLVGSFPVTAYLSIALPLWLMNLAYNSNQYTKGLSLSLKFSGVNFLVVMIVMIIVSIVAPIVVNKLFPDSDN